MKLRALGSVLSALVACGLVSMVVTDPLTTVEAVPESSPSPTSTAPVAPVARNVDLPRDATYVTEYDPLSAATPEVAGQSEVPVPLPTAPKTITKEKVKPIGKANPDALLTRPVNGRTTSKFGMRFHPVLKVWKLHTGLDWEFRVAPRSAPRQPGPSCAPAGPAATASRSRSTTACSPATVWSPPTTTCRPSA